MILRTACLAALLSGILVAMLSAPAAADDGLFPGDTIVTTGARTPTAADTLGTSISLLEGEEIERRQIPVMSDLLRAIPGLAVNRAGAAGQLTQVRIRGAEGNHTLVLIDGIEANELNFNGEFDFSGLLAIGIERVEILRGAQSALYGSDAIGGVINVITKGGEPGFEAAASAEGGSFGTFQATALISGGVERFTGAVSAGYLETDGINLSRFGDEKDGSRIVTVNGKARATLFENVTAQAMLRYADTRADNDGQDFDFPPTPTNGLAIDNMNRQFIEQLYTGFNLDGSFFEGGLEFKTSVGFSRSEREFVNDSNDLTGNEGERLKLTQQFTTNFDAWGGKHTLTAAYEREEMDFENFGAVPDALENQRRSDNQDSFIGEYRLGVADQVYLSAGIRHDDNALFDNATTYRVAGAWLIPSSGTRLHGSWGTAVTNPGFFELFGFFPDFFLGNPNLQPEKSESFDIGVEQRFFDDRLKLDVTYFNADLTDEIVTVFDFATFLSTVENLDGKSKREGVEVILAAQLSDQLSLSGSYTYTKSRQPDGMREVRRPKHIANFNANYAFGDGRGNLNLDVSYNGKQLDNEFIAATPEARVTLDSYVLVTLAAEYQLTDNIALFGRIENALDQDYEEVFSFRSPGIGAYGGLRVRLGE
ncbi:MAG: TonB-dependent receptor plug domain-containing protein [Alphaproteobacteria bacterium]